VKHSIGIPDWIWEYERQKTGTKNPASSLRDRLARVIAEEKMAVESKPDLLPDKDTVDLPEGDDYPTGITVSRPGICHICKTLIPAGDFAFYYTVYHGNRAFKVVSHPECWDSNA
jgi:hypothetical protein